VRVISASNNVLLEVKKFSYFCHHCIDVIGDCTSKGYVEPWKLVTLKPCVALDVLCDVEYDENDWGVGEDNNGLAIGLRVGDNFVVVTTPSNYEELISLSCSVSKNCIL